MRLTASPLWDRIDHLGLRAVAIVGVSKHAGKTTVLSRLIEDASLLGRPLGVVSVGIDGERADSVLGTPKPRIHVPAGTFFASALGAFGTGYAPVRWLEPLGIPSVLGEVWIGQAIEEGDIVLAGIRQLDHLLRFKEQLAQRAHAHLLVDGALARMVAIHPDVADGVILATGAVLGSLPAVEQGTRQALLRLTTPVWQPPAEVANRLAQDAAQSGVWVGQLSAAAAEVIDWDRVDICDLRYLGDAHAFAGDWRTLGAGDERLYIAQGAVTDAVVSALTKREQSVLLVARDPSCLFISAEVWKGFARRGHALRVLRAPVLVGVAVNPTAPRGPGLDRTLLRTRIAALTDVPVWDVMDA
ncbi:MAG: hypothetical protein OWT28_03740 [Firmicutes bacterium]|nr:hypothetical protein [Bacillota bacterium]